MTWKMESSLSASPSTNGHHAATVSAAELLDTGVPFSPNPSNFSTFPDGIPAIPKKREIS
jgi:hypothetical protein